MYLTQVKLYRDHYPTDQFYPFNIPALRMTSELVFTKPVIFFVGENGDPAVTLMGDGQVGETKAPRHSN